MVGSQPEIKSTKYTVTVQLLPTLVRSTMYQMHYFTLYINYVSVIKWRIYVLGILFNNSLLCQCANT